jgi:hypothetical protein
MENHEANVVASLKLLKGSIVSTCAWQSCVVHTSSLKPRLEATRVVGRFDSP